jgi:hypothetical protein
MSDDESTPLWRDPKAMFFFFGSIMLLMLVLGIWVDDGRFALTGVVAIIPTCAAAIAWASRDM